MCMWYASIFIFHVQYGIQACHGEGFHLIFITGRGHVTPPGSAPPLLVDSSFHDRLILGVIILTKVKLLILFFY